MIISTYLGSTSIDPMRKVHRDKKTSNIFNQSSRPWILRLRLLINSKKKAYSAPQLITFLYSNSEDGMIYKDL